MLVFVLVQKRMGAFRFGVCCVVSLPASLVGDRGAGGGTDVTDAEERGRVGRTAVEAEGEPAIEGESAGGGRSRTNRATEALRSPLATTASAVGDAMMTDDDVITCGGTGSSESVPSVRG